MGIGGKVPGILKSTEETDEIIAIDGCALICAKKSPELAGFTVDKHIVLTELGMQKNKDLDLQESEVKEIMTRVENALSN